MTLNYQSGFSNEFATEALEGALPVGRNSPRRRGRLVAIHPSRRAADDLDAGLPLLRSRLVRSQSRAVGFIYPKLDSEICRNCDRQIFRECKTTLPNGEPRQQPPLVPTAAAAR